MILGRGLGVIISVGRWGGIYIKMAWAWRVCLGWIAITVIPRDGDDLLAAAAEYGKLMEADDAE